MNLKLEQVRSQRILMHSCKWQRKFYDGKQPQKLI